MHDYKYYKQREHIFGGMILTIEQKVVKNWIYFFCLLYLPVFIFPFHWESKIRFSQFFLDAQNNT